MQVYIGRKNSKVPLVFILDLTETGKNAPSLDNLLILSRLFKVPLEELIKVRDVEVDAQCSQHAADCMNQDEETCEACRFRKSVN